jgi:hypothetical protein
MKKPIQILQYGLFTGLCLINLVMKINLLQKSTHIKFIE